MADNLESKVFLSSGESKSLTTKIVDTIKDNKLYICLGLFIFVLGIGLYFYFVKNKSETLSKLTKFMNKKSNDSNDSIVLDADGNSVKNIDLQQMQQQQMQQQQQQIQQQQIQQQMQNMEQQKNQRVQKMDNEGPSEDLNSDENNLESYNLNDIEDPLVSMQHLTNSELKEIEEELSN